MLNGSLFNKKETDELEVKINKSRTYRYIKIGSDGRQYFCLKQNPLMLLWLLYFKKDTLNLIFAPWAQHTSADWGWGYIRYCYQFFINNLKTVIFFVRRQRKLAQSSRNLVRHLFQKSASWSVFCQSSATARTYRRFHRTLQPDIQTI